MKYLNFVIDLDNTLFYNDIVDKACYEAGVPHPVNHDLSDAPLSVQDRCWKEFEDENRMCSFEPYADVVGIDKLLKDKGHRVIVLSARSHKMYTRTVQMVKKHYPYVDDIILLQSYDKGSSYISLNADVVVDDHANHVIQALDVGVKYVIMISNNHTIYNYKSIEEVKSKGAEVFPSARSLEQFISMYELMENK